MLTPEELAAIRQRAAAATPGPWLTIQPGGPNGPFWGVCNSTGRIVIMRGSVNRVDAEFIVAARTDVVELLAEVDQLRAACQRALDANPLHNDADAELYSVLEAALGR